ncbi:MAG TPA: glucan biosynthesis protein G [Myxococcota bacterium]|nr:glucan biosynthesis protein G [Myxococcota bacterium]
MPCARVRSAAAPACAAVRALRAGLVLALALAAGPAAAFDMDEVAARAQALAAAPYRARAPVPAWMRSPEHGGSMSYDQWRDIRFRPDHALWRERGSAFQVQFFHPGLYYDRSVQIHAIEDGGVQTVPFDPERFHYGKNDFADRIPRDVGYAGFRVHYPLKTADYRDEVIVFLGASYFRAVGRDNVYGLSARGVAVDTVEPSGEEFPDFTDFWLETPAPDAIHLVVYALLDGPSLAGAYRFDVYPGLETRVEIEARLFPRKPVRKLGIAPLTSMFFFGENTTRAFDDFRPEVHDSDGLLLHLAGGEWLWRPVDNPTRIDVASFAAPNPLGFGLLQRDRDFRSYEDIETRMERRPSAWVEPRGDWGPGRVELVRLPTQTELVDNLVAYFVPDGPVDPAVPRTLAFRYAVSFYGDDPGRPPAGRAVATRRDSGSKGAGQRFVVDFDGERLRALPDDAPPDAVVSVGPRADAAALLDQHVVRHPGTGGWRLSFQLRPASEEPIELRAYLKRGDDVLSETWSYSLLPTASEAAASRTDRTSVQ